MDSTTNNKSLIRPKTFAELLPGLTGILTKDAIQSLTAKKRPRNTSVLPRTTEKSYNLKPKTMVEMSAYLQALKAPSPRRNVQATSAMKKKWNSSVKVDQKRTNHTGDGHLKNASARKVLNFQTNSKHQPQVNAFNSKTTLAATECPAFIKPDFKPKKSLMTLQGRNNIRISGVCNIPETPVLNHAKKYPLNRFTLANKENIDNNKEISRKVQHITNVKKPLFSKSNVTKDFVPDTPISNASSSDASFLQREKEIQDIEQKEDQMSVTLENIAEISPPVSTPFRNYRSVQTFFNDSSEVENSLLLSDNTILCFNKQIDIKTEEREESVIVSLCELFNKTKVTDVNKPNKDLSELLAMEEKILNNIKLMEKIIEAEKMSLSNLRKLIKEKNVVRQSNKILQDRIEVSVKSEAMSIQETTSRDFSVIKSCVKSPSYKIPKKNSCLRKKVFCKSMPNVFNEESPELKKEHRNICMSMYMNMKEQMNFLNTPVTKKRSESAILDTPAVTSHNLQVQLDRLYNNS